MKVTDWMLAQNREEQWDTFLRYCPVCTDCGRVVHKGRVLPLEENGSYGCLCPACVRDRMISVEEDEEG